MNVLVLGGTQFVGRAIVEALLAEGLHVTLFHRGRTAADLFPECSHLIGDRTADIQLAMNQNWNAVIDVSAYLPSQIRAALSLRTKHYVFVSTISVYDPSQKEGTIDESYPTFTAEEADEVTPKNYGPLKVKCEELLEPAFGTKLTVLRPGIIFGPHDPTGRFPYWIQRFDLYDQILLPNRLDAMLQWIDVRDLAQFVLRCTTHTVLGTFNLTGPRMPITEVFDEIRTQTPRLHELVIADLEELKSLEVRPWIDLPLIHADESGARFFDVSSQKAIDAGLTFRSVSKTVSATLEWTRQFPHKVPGKYGMSREKEEQVLQALKSKMNVIN